MFPIIDYPAIAVEFEVTTRQEIVFDLLPGPLHA
jgi:hypothetical protein